MTTTARVARTAVAVPALGLVAAALLVHAQLPATASPAPTTASAAAAAAPARVTHRAATTYVAHDEAGNMAFVDLGAPSPQGPDIGDVVAFTQTLTRGGKQVGLAHVAAIVVDHKRHLSQANGTLQIPGGTVEVAGTVTMTSRFTLAVTGGTGRYTGARGVLKFHNDHGRQLLKLKLR
jgi:hypothetical protein